MIDAGCGLGGTALYLQARTGGVYHGVTLSPQQRVRAQSAARRRGVAEACRFHVRSYDGDLRDLAGEGADLIVAIESLAHSPDPARTILNLAGFLAPGGRLVIVDDVPAPTLPEDDPDLCGFRAGWRCEAIARSDVLVAAISASGLEPERDEDLTPRVILREPARRERLVRINRRIRALLGRTDLGDLVDSLYGGLMLERLYARGVIAYRMVVARKR